MDYKWLGPYTITKDCGKGFYALKDSETGLEINHIHGAHLKVFTTPPNLPKATIKGDNDLDVSLTSEVAQLSPLDNALLQLGLIPASSIQLSPVSSIQFSPFFL